jgi:hypothetical protein
MVRALPGQLSKGSTMMTRDSSKRKYRPCIEGLERKDLCSNGLLAVAPSAFVFQNSPETPSPPALQFATCGTGKGTIIITR